MTGFASVGRRDFLRTVVAGGFAVTGSRTVGASSQTAASSTWSQYRAGPQRHGAVAESPDPTSFEHDWALPKGETLKGGRVQSVVSDGERLYLSTHNSHVFSVARDGDVAWTREVNTNASSPVLSPLALSEDYLVLVEGDEYSEARITGRSTEDGERRWSVPVEVSDRDVPPLLYDGSMYFVDGHRVKSFNVSEREIEWDEKHPGAAMGVSAGVDELVVNRDSPDPRSYEGVTGLEYGSGAKTWTGDTFDYAYDARTAPVVAPSLGSAFVADGVYMIRCFELGSGDLQWTFLSRKSDGNHIDSNRLIPAYSDETLYFGGRAGIVYSVDATNGELNWRTAPGHDIESASRYSGSPQVKQPVRVAGEYLYARVGDRVFALERESGEVVWTNGGLHEVQCVLPDRVVLEGNYDGVNGLHVFTEESPTTTPTVGGETATTSASTADGDATTGASVGTESGTAEDATSSGVPGFGVAEGVASVVGAAYLADRYSSRED